MKIGISKQAFVDKDIANAMIGHINPETTAIKHKYGFSGKEKVRFDNISITNPSDLMNMLCQGKTYSHPLNISGDYGMSQKTNKNFNGTCIIPLDIDDTKANCPKDYIGKLSIKPTFYYTTYSNGLPNKGTRFRMFYCFNSMSGKSYLNYRYLASKLVGIIENDTSEKLDHCSLVAAQYFNGTNMNTAAHFDADYYGNIYSWTDIGADKDDYVRWLTEEDKDGKIAAYSESGYRRNHYNICKELGIPYYNLPGVKIDEKLIHEYEKYGANHWFRKNFHYLSLPKQTWTKPWTPDIPWQYVNEDEPFVKIFYHPNKIKTGDGRRRTLIGNAEVYRIINPQATPEQIFFMLAMDNYDLLEEPLSVESIIEYTQDLFNKTDEEIWNNQKEWIDQCTANKPEFILNPFIDFENTRSKTKKQYVRQIKGQITDAKIYKSHAYNPNVGVSENLKLINQVDPTITYEQVRRYHSIRKTDPEKMKLNIKANYNTGLSLRENTEIINDIFHTEFSKDTISRIVQVDFSSEQVKQNKREEKQNKREEELINSGLIDPEQSLRWNMRILQENGIKFSRPTLENVLAKLKEERHELPLANEEKEEIITGQATPRPETNNNLNFNSFFNNNWSLF